MNRNPPFRFFPTFSPMIMTGHYHWFSRCICWTSRFCSTYYFALFVYIICAPLFTWYVSYLSLYLLPYCHAPCMRKIRASSRERRSKEAVHAAVQPASKWRKPKRPLWKYDPLTEMPVSMYQPDTRYYVILVWLCKQGTKLNIHPWWTRRIPTWMACAVCRAPSAERRASSAAYYNICTWYSSIYTYVVPF